MFVKEGNSGRERHSRWKDEVTSNGVSARWVVHMQVVRTGFSIADTEAPTCTLKLSVWNMLSADM